jgi:hypothetical protein
MAGQSADGPSTGGSASSVDFSTRGTDAIPGTKRRCYLGENIAATELELTDEDIAAVEAAAPHGVVTGDRYAPGMMGPLPLP